MTQGLRVRYWPRPVDLRWQYRRAVTILERLEQEADQGRRPRTPALVGELRAWYGLVDRLACELEQEREDPQPEQVAGGPRLPG